jgi:hypothetical protein
MSTSKTKRISQIFTVVAFLIPLTLLVAIIIQSTLEIQSFNRDYTIKLQNIINIEPRNQPEPQPKTTEQGALIHKAEAKEIEPTKLSTEDYICYKFGTACNMALAVSQAENGTRQCDRITIEPNNTVSIGLFQINSVHFNKYPLSQLITCQGNVDAALDIYDNWNSWQPWSVYKNGSYKRFLK